MKQFSLLNAYLLMVTLSLSTTSTTSLTTFGNISPLDGKTITCSSIEFSTDLHGDFVQCNNLTVDGIYASNEISCETVWYDYNEGPWTTSFSDICYNIGYSKSFQLYFDCGNIATRFTYYVEPGWSTTEDDGFIRSLRCWTRPTLPTTSLTLTSPTISLITLTPSSIPSSLVPTSAPILATPLFPTHPQILNIEQCPNLTPGMGVGRDEYRLGIVSSIEECVQLIQKYIPYANGATIAPGVAIGIPGWCYGEVGVDKLSPGNNGFETCLIPEMVCDDIQGWSDVSGHTCEWYKNDNKNMDRCYAAPNFLGHQGIDAQSACCYCGGGMTPGEVTPPIHQKFTESSILQLVLMSDEVKNGAVCLDGTPGAFYIAQPNKQNSQWIIFFEGGGWCFSESDCLSRFNSDFASSKAYPFIMSRTGWNSGIIGSNSTLNPEFAESNLVFIKYCDGNSFSGNRDSPINTTGTPLYFRGRRILDSVLSTLLKKYGLNNATDVLLSGCSSGGLAAYLHADYIGEVLKNNLPNLVRYKVAPVSGFFLDHSNIVGTPVYSEQMKSVFMLSNATYNLNDKCIADKTEENFWQCNMAPYVYPYINTPIMIINSALDTFQVGCILAAEPSSVGAFNCTARPEYPSGCACWECPIENKCTSDNFVSFRNYENDFMASLAESATYLKLGNGAFIHSCYTHCAGSRDDYYNSLSINGITVQQAISAWWNDKNTSHNYVPCQVQGPGQKQCNPTCDKNTGSLIISSTHVSLNGSSTATPLINKNTGSLIISSTRVSLNGSSTATPLIRSSTGLNIFSSSMNGSSTSKKGKGKGKGKGQEKYDAKSQENDDDQKSISKSNISFIIGSILLLVTIIFGILFFTRKYLNKKNNVELEFSLLQDTHKDSMLSHEI